MKEYFLARRQIIFVVSPSQVSGGFEKSDSFIRALNPDQMKNTKYDVIKGGYVNSDPVEEVEHDVIHGGLDAFNRETENDLNELMQFSQFN